MKLKIEFEDTGQMGRYYSEVKGERVQFIYSHAGEGVISADHVYVPKEFEGRGIALALVTHAVEDARARGWKIRPCCSYVAVKFDQHPEWADVRAPEVS